MIRLAYRYYQNTGHLLFQPLKHNYLMQKEHFEKKVTQILCKSQNHQDSCFIAPLFLLALNLRKEIKLSKNLVGYKKKKKREIKRKNWSC